MARPAAPAATSVVDSALTTARATTAMDHPRGPRRHGIGLCLSGGGYRAALFHLGALRRLDELGILASVRTVSGVSGGSIVASLLRDPGLGWPTGPGRPTGRVEGFDELIAAPLRRLTRQNVRTPALLSTLLPRRWFVRDAAVRALADAFARLVPWWSASVGDDLAGGPAVVVGATEIGYGVDWVFMDPHAARPHGRLGDYRAGYAAPTPQVRLADAVAASCAVPPFFGPMRFGPELGLRGGHAGPESARARAAILDDIQLTDGGVYDNLGLEPVWKDHAAVLVSDGGGVFQAASQRTIYGRLLQIMAIATAGGGTTRMRWLLASMRRGVLDGATWALDTVTDASYPAPVCARITVIRTDLDRFSPDEQKVLERHGYLVADAMVRAHAPALVLVDAPLAPPHEEVADPAYAMRALRRSHRRTLLGRF